MKIVHFDVDKNLKTYLKTNSVSFSLTKENLNKIKNKEKVKIISFKTQSSLLENSVIELFPNLKLLITRTAGTDHINLDLCKSKNIAVYNIPNYGSENIAEHAMAMMLACARNIVQAQKKIKEGKFSYEDFLGTSIKGKIIGVIGTGKIGISFIKLLKGFDAKIIAFDVIKNQAFTKEFNFEYVPLEKLLKISDFISIHVPLLPQTKHMIGDREIKKMKKGVILINASRGAVIDEKALKTNIKKFKALGLDVLEDEKNFSKKHPLLRFENVIITPHCAFYSDETVKKIAEETLKNIKRFYNKNNTNKIV